MPALLLDLIRDRRGEIIRGGAPHRFVFETADAIKRCLIEPLEQNFEIGIGLAGKADGRFIRFSTSGEAC